MNRRSIVSALCATVLAAHWDRTNGSYRTRTDHEPASDGSGKYRRPKAAARKNRAAGRADQTASAGRQEQQKLLERSILRARSKQAHVQPRMQLGGDARVCNAGAPPVRSIPAVGAGCGHLVTVQGDAAGQHTTTTQSFASPSASATRLSRRSVLSMPRSSGARRNRRQRHRNQLRRHSLQHFRHQPSFGNQFLHAELAHRLPGRFERYWARKCSATSKLTSLATSRPPCS